MAIIMKAAVRYYTQTGNTKKLANAIAQELKLEAKPVSEPLKENIDILFLCNSVYWAGADKSVKQFLIDNSSKIGTVVNVSTAALIQSTFTQIKKIAAEAGVKLSEKEFHCKGKFAALHKGHPNDEDLRAARLFAKEIVK